MVAAPRRPDPTDRPPTPEAVRPWLALRAVPGLGEAGVRRLIEAFGSPQAARAASAQELVARGGIAGPVADAVKRGPDRETARQIDRELTRLETLRLSVVTFLDPLYPARLRAIHDPPPVLYVSGRLAGADRHAVAVVGSRQPSAAGRIITERFGRELAAAGFTVVSGMARGIDAAAHRGALSASGRTIAVLGCGADQTYPPEHAALREAIEADGAVLSELPLGTPPHSGNFPKRNRIISGMSLGVVVTEAGIPSGSLITARLALEQGREVFAVPGAVGVETSRGPHSLIKQGAKLVETVEDIIEELLPQLDVPFREHLVARAPAQSGAKPALSAEEAAIYALFPHDAIHIDDLIVRSGRRPGDMSGLLLSMELKGLIRQLPGHSYIRI
jgi:DNA processing protein